MAQETDLMGIAPPDLATNSYSLSVAEAELVQRQETGLQVGLQHPVVKVWPPD